MRLFVAIELPDAIAAALSHAIGPKERGVSLVPPRLMHLTLHFLGDADAARAASALKSVRCTPFALSVRSAGRFALRGGKSVLWAGVGDSAELRDLHRRCGDAFRAHDVFVDERPFVPHVTLARFGSSSRADLLDEWSAAIVDRDFGSFTVRGMTLFNSTTITGDKVYEEMATADFY